MPGSGRRGDLQRSQSEKGFVYKKKGSEQQAALNRRVDEALAECQGELASVTSGPTPPPFKRAHKALENGRELISKRQKLIKIADRSEYGWAVVAEYTTDELAVDSDDEKCLKKAEHAAEQKALKRKKKAVGGVRKQSRFGQGVVAQAGGQSAPLPTTSFQQPSGCTRRSAGATMLPRPLGPCYAGSETGHLCHCCPKTSVLPDGRKWYPPIPSTRGVDVGCGDVDAVCGQVDSSSGKDGADCAWE